MTAAGNRITPKADPPWPRRLGCQMVLLAVVVVLLLAGAWAYWLWRSTPAYWTRNAALLKSMDNPTLLQLADDLEKRLTADLTDPGPDGAAEGYLNKSRTISVSLAEINAWLAVKLDTWALNRGVTLPPQMKGPMLAAEGDNLVLAFQYQTPQFSQIVSAFFKLELLPDGQARIKIQSIHGGELPIPADSLVKRLKKFDSAGGRAKHVQIPAPIFDGTTFSPVHEIDATRQIRLVGYRLRPDGADVTIRTEPREAKAK